MNSEVHRSWDTNKGSLSKSSSLISIFSVYQQLSLSPCHPSMTLPTMTNGSKATLQAMARWILGRRATTTGITTSNLFPRII
ncbi:unnamed protein product [Penicillium egyptiacum]|uniref:Uncharacterized protein n=1 Tax=Penicillium egyptiacum TaxID=1303716 RepID=A0A9W4K753_9EURO|nr:unnamed protein product [Penicillium egyptiacum]